MAIGTNSYGSVAEVEAVTKIFAGSGYSTTTTPTLAQVERFIDRQSAILNAYLAKAGFTIPVNQADAAMICADWVTRMAANLVHAAKNSAPFQQARELRGGIVADATEAQRWVAENADGLEALGAARSAGSALTDGMGFREYDDGDNEIAPFFSRDMMGWDRHAVDWDTE